MKFLKRLYSFFFGKKKQTIDYPCVVWYFNNSGSVGEPIETWTYVNSQKVVTTISAEVGLSVSACVLEGTVPTVGSLGDNPWTATDNSLERSAPVIVEIPDHVAEQLAGQAVVIKKKKQNANSKK